MPSERMQRQIDRLLDEAETAAGEKDWAHVADCARKVLAVDASNEDAAGFLSMAEGQGDKPQRPQDPQLVAEAASAVPLPSSFAGGRYSVRAFLGEGAKKRVYLAHDQKLDRDVAFALIKTEGLDADGLLRIRREAQAMGRLGDHPQIVTVYDAGDEGGAPYIVTQYMSGGSVEDLLVNAERHRLATDRAMRIAEQVCAALEHAHERGVVHRDIKPGNVWLSQDGTTAAVGDFGLAVALDRSRMTMQGMMVGTVAYMAPEQALGRAPDARSDVYSLGAMLYEMVAGRPPFLGDDAIGVISQHINTPPVSPAWHNSEVPRPLEVLIMRMLAKSHDERPASATDVATELRRIRERSTLESLIAPQVDVRPDLRVIDWGRFVGRQGEMDQLKAALEDVLSGNGSITFLAGEPGIGKTRLAEEFGVYAGLRGAQVLVGHCYEGESTVPYRPFVEAFRQYVRASADDDLRREMGTGAAELATLISDIRERFPDIAEAPALSGDTERLRLFESVTAFVHSAAHTKPLVMFLDDLHWADKGSLQLLQQIARNTISDRVLIVGTYRDIDLDRQHPLADALVTLRRQPNFQRVLLRGLPQEAIHELLTSIEPSEELAAGRLVIAAALYRETEGNPFFVREILSHLVEEGKIYREGGRWQARVSVSDMGIPEGVREVIGRRLSRLSVECNQMLTLASTMTGGFTWEVLKAVSDEPEAKLLDLLEEALAAQIVAEHKGDGIVRYDFTHALIRQTLYDELSTPRRVLMHRRIGEALETLFAENAEPHMAELAHHFFQAAPGGDVAKAIDYTMRAGDRSAALNGHEDAVVHYERALQAMDTFSLVDNDRRCVLLLKLGEAQRKAGNPAKAIATFREAAALARTSSSDERLAEAAIGFAETAWRIHGDVGLRPESVRLLTQALNALGEGDSAVRVKALGLRVMAARSSNASDLADALASGGLPTYLGGRDDEQVGQAREAVVIAERIGDLGLQVYALFQLRGALWRPDNPKERLEISEEMLRIAQVSSDVVREFEARNWRAIDLLDLGRVDDFSREIDEMARLAAITREPAHRWYATGYRAGLTLARGDFVNGERQMMEALAIGQHATAEAVPGFGAQFNTLRVWQSRAAEAMPLMRQAADQSPNQAVYLGALAWDLCATEDYAGARGCLKQMASMGWRGLPRDFLWLGTLGLAARTSYLSNESSYAAELYELLLPCEQMLATYSPAIPYAPVARELAVLAVLLERPEAARRHFERGLAELDAMHFRPELAVTQVWYAGFLLQEGGAPDRSLALELLQQALDTAQELGMPKVVEDCLALKVKAQGLDRSSMSLFTSIDRVASAARDERPNVWREAIAPDGTVTIMFSDIEDSTVLTERVGDQAWQDLLRKHNALIREQLQAYGGYEVKTLGDGFMVAFQSAKKGLDCAIAIQRAFAEHNATDGEHMNVRIGLHAGEAIKDGDDFYGKNVIMASRVAGKAGGGEILVSSLLRQLVESSMDRKLFGEPREIDLKGLSGTHALYAVAWPPV